MYVMSRKCGKDRAQTGEKHGSIHFRLKGHFLSQWETLSLPKWHAALMLG